MQVYPRAQAEIELKSEITTSLNEIPQINLTNKRSPNELFGRFIKYARQNGEMRLLAGLDDVESVGIENNKFMFVCKGEICKNLIEEHKQFVSGFLSQNGLANLFDCKIKVNEQEQTEQKLKELFGEKLKIV